jgi:hypothetical protein
MSELISDLEQAQYRERFNRRNARDNKVMEYLRRTHIIDSAGTSFGNTYAYLTPEGLYLHDSLFRDGDELVMGTIYTDKIQGGEAEYLAFLEVANQKPRVEEGAI